MSVNKSRMVAALSGTFRPDIVNALIEEYQQIKIQLVLRKFQPSELQGGRFGECVMRLLEQLNGLPVTDLGKQIEDRDKKLNITFNNVRLPEGIRFHVSYLVRVLLDIRNKRNVAHVGTGEISPNYSDSLIISQISDWILIELIRNYYGCPIDEARRIVQSINQTHVPIVADMDGVLRVQESTMNYGDKTLVLLYFKHPNKVSEKDLFRWSEYSNFSVYRKKILFPLHKDVIIHLQDGFCQLTPKGVRYVQDNLPLELT